MNDYKSFLEIDGEVRKIILTAGQDGGERFLHVFKSEVRKYINGHLSNWLK
jgi:hypothetical protein